MTQIQSPQITASPAALTDGLDSHLRFTGDRLPTAYISAAEMAFHRDRAHALRAATLDVALGASLGGLFGRVVAQLAGAAAAQPPAPPRKPSWSLLVTAK